MNFGDLLEGCGRKAFSERSSGVGRMIAGSGVGVGGSVFHVTQQGLVEVGRNDDGVFRIVANEGVAIERLGRGFHIAHDAGENGRMASGRRQPLDVVRVQRVEEVLLVLVLRIADQRKEGEFFIQQSARRQLGAPDELNGRPHGDGGERIQNLRLLAGVVTVADFQSFRRYVDCAPEEVQFVADSFAIFTVKVLQRELERFQTGGAARKRHGSQIIDFVPVGWFIRRGE